MSMTLTLEMVRETPAGASRCGGATPGATGSLQATAASAANAAASSATFATREVARRRAVGARDVR
jgi:hypothetical protein